MAGVGVGAVCTGVVAGVGVGVVFGIAITVVTAGVAAVDIHS